MRKYGSGGDWESVEPKAKANGLDDPDTDVVKTVVSLTLNFYLAVENIVF